MKIEDFWNQAFIACLTRVPPKQAKKQADEATSLCIEHWQTNMKKLGISQTPQWKDQDVAHVPMLGHDYRALMHKQAGDVAGPKSQKQVTRARD